MTATRAQVQDLNRKMKEAHDLGDREAWAEARDAFRAVIKEAEALGIQSAFAWMRLSTVHLELNEVEEAFAAISRCLLLDLVLPGSSSAFNSAVAAMRDLLERRSDNAADDAPPRLYAALSRIGETDPRCHVALARHHLRDGRLEEARALLEATTLLEPAGADAWTLLADVAKRHGDEAKAKELQARALALKEAGTPFGIPSPTATC